MFARLLLLFITVPVIEMLLFVKIGTKIGFGTTLWIIIITGFLGAWLTKKQGLRTWQKFRQTSSSGQLPASEAVEALLILIAGAVLLTPGFLTDAVGFSLLVPGVRSIIRDKIIQSFKGKVQVGNLSSFTPPSAPKESGGERVAKGRVIDSE